jgi:FkbM family methyltransferase
MYLPPPLHRARKFAKRVVARTANEITWQRAAADAPVVLTDDTGFRFTFHPWMRPYAKNLLRRSSTAGQWAAVAALVRPNDVVFDVGAHVGRFSAFVNRLLSDEGRVFAFEPVPDSFWMFMENMALNRCTRVIATQAAVSDRAGSVTMNLFPPEFSSWNSMGQPVMKTPTGLSIAPGREVAVPATTLDAACVREGIARIDFLKVDVEGFEKAVFDGARGLLSRRRIGRICFEISADPLRGAGMTARDVFATLESYGYGVHGYDDAARRFTPRVHDTDAQWANFYASVEPLERAVNPAASISALAA